MLLWVVDPISIGNEGIERVRFIHIAGGAGVTVLR